MSTLLIDELFAGVTFEQAIRITRDVSVAHIRPWIYKEGTLVDGDFQLEILQGATSLITKTINFATINTAIPQDFAHGFIRFDFDSLILRLGQGVTEQEYTLKFSMINHSTNLNNYIAISRRWETAVYPLFDTALNDSVKPGGLEIYEYKET